MSKNSETGHAKNVANFNTLITVCNGYGAKYNPAKSNLTMEVLKKQLQQGGAVIKTVNSSATQFNRATNERSDAFSGFKQFATQLMNALAVSGASAGTLADARAINRKIQGKRAEAKPLQINPEDGQSDAQVAKTISVSQQSYDLQLEHLSKLNELLLAEEQYKPNEAELSTGAVAQKLQLLTAANQQVITAYTDYSNQLIARDVVLYDPVIGLVATAKDVKKYVLSVYKANSPEYKQINAIAFRTVKPKK
jgi:hypothetical protein